MINGFSYKWGIALMKVKHGPKVFAVMAIFLIVITVTNYIESEHVKDIQAKVHLSLQSISVQDIDSIVMSHVNENIAVNQKWIKQSIPDFVSILKALEPYNPSHPYPIFDFSVAFKKVGYPLIITIHYVQSSGAKVGFAEINYSTSKGENSTLFYSSKELQEWLIGATKFEK